MNASETLINPPPPPFDDAAAAQARSRWNAIAKPMASLGHLEEAVTQIAGLTGDPRYAIDKRVVLVLCADNGVVRQGVAQTGAEVTAILAGILTEGNITVCKMAEIAKCDVIGVDMGMNTDLNLPNLLNKRIAAGANDIAEGPAMTREQALTAISYGIELAETMARQGYRILATGEIGMGNTTTSSAMTAVFLNKPAAEVTGCGAGLSAEKLQHKIAIIEKAIAVNRPDPGDALDVLAKLGGFDIAGMTGIFLGAAQLRLPVLIDGLISSVAALTAQRLCPESRHAMLASHISAEPAGQLVLSALGVKPLICAGMHLGEGTGAVAALPLLDMAYAVYDRMVTYGDIDIERYQPHG